jgi:hypothetical protein
MEVQFSVLDFRFEKFKHVNVQLVSQREYSAEQSVQNRAAGQYHGTLCTNDDFEKEQHCYVGGQELFDSQFSWLPGNYYISARRAFKMK